jgi:hypothetical protein
MLERIRPKPGFTPIQHASACHAADVMQMLREAAEVGNVRFRVNCIWRRRADVVRWRVSFNAHSDITGWDSGRAYECA